VTKKNKYEMHLIKFNISYAARYIADKSKRLGDYNSIRLTTKWLGSDPEPTPSF